MRCHLLNCVILVLLTGCGGKSTNYGSLNLVDVTGKVTMDGEPLAGVRVMFEADDKTFSQGVTTESGMYRLAFNSERNGVTAGRKVVRLTRAAGDGDDPDDDSQKRKAAGPPIPERYHRRSELVADVQPGQQSFDFGLKSN